MADPELVRRVAESTGLSPAEASRVIADVMFYHRETPHEFVRRRHHELQRDGKRNPEIFGALSRELAERVFAPPQYSHRQLRRIIYT
jgi:hypothetical protein